MKNKKIFAALFFIILTAVFTAPALAIELIPAECREDTGTGCTLCSFIDMFVTGADILVALSGSFCLLMIIYGGMMIITAYGAEDRITNGKKVINAAITGIVFVFLSWTLIGVLVLSLYGNDKGVFSKAFQTATEAAGRKTDWSGSGTCATKAYPADRLK